MNFIINQKQQKDCRKQNACGERNGFFDSEPRGKGISRGHQHAVDNDPQDSKPYFAFIVEFFQSGHHLIFFPSENA